MLDDPRHERAVLAFIGGATHGEIAEQLDVTDRTIRRWFALDDVRAELEHQRRECLAQSRAAIAASAMSAAHELRRLLKSKDEAIRLRAATSILDRAGLGPAQRHEIAAPGGDERMLTAEEVERLEQEVVAEFIAQGYTPPPDDGGS